MTQAAAVRQVLIVDDEAPARERLMRLVGELDGWQASGTCSSGSQALAAIAENRPDVVLLDIEMPGMTGLEVAQRLAESPAPPAVVFTTAYDQFALDAFDTRAAGYVLKPVRRERLAAALDHARHLADALRPPAGPAAAPREHIGIRVRDELKVVAVRDIRYFEADQKYTTVHHDQGEDLIEVPLKQLEQEFDAAFVRIHRSLLVAVAAVDRVERDADGAARVRLRGDDRPLPVSRRQIAELKARLAGRR